MPKLRIIINEVEPPQDFTNSAFEINNLVGALTARLESNGYHVPRSGAFTIWVGDRDHYAEMVESLYDLSPQQLHALREEAHMIANSPEHQEAWRGH